MARDLSGRPGGSAGARTGLAGQQPLDVTGELFHQALADLADRPRGVLRDRAADHQIGADQYTRAGDVRLDADGHARVGAALTGTFAP